MWVENYECYEIDDSYDDNVLYNRIEKAYKDHGCLIIAYDLDDSVRPFKSQSCKDTISIIKRCNEVLNVIFIVYTASTDMEANKQFLKDNDLPYDAINDYPENFPVKKFKDELDTAYYYGNTVPKLYYNILLDDKSCGLKNACDILDRLCDKVECQKKKEQDEKNRF